MFQQSERKKCLKHVIQWINKRICSKKNHLIRNRCNIITCIFTGVQVYINPFSFFSSLFFCCYRKKNKKKERAKKWNQKNATVEWYSRHPASWWYSSSWTKYARTHTVNCVFQCWSNHHFHATNFAWIKWKISGATRSKTWHGDAEHKRKIIKVKSTTRFGMDLCCFDIYRVIANQNETNCTYWWNFTRQFVLAGFFDGFRLGTEFLPVFYGCIFSSICPFSFSSFPFISLSISLVCASTFPFSFNLLLLLFFHQLARYEL